MFSKTPAIVVIVLAGLLSACSGEKEQSAQPIAPSFKNGGECLSQLGDRLSDFFADRMSQNEVIAFWDCTSDAVGDFRKITTGSLPKGNYTPEAIGGFLHRYFLDEALPSPLLREIMQLKRVLLLGSNEEVSREELTRAQDLLMELKAFSLEIHPHVSVLFRNREGASDYEITAAAQVFKRALTRLSDWLSRNNQSYEIGHLQALIVELNRWNNPDKDEDGLLQTIENFSGVLPHAKRLLLGGDKNLIAGEDWAKILLSVGEVFHVYLSVTHGMDKNLDVVLTSQSLPASVKGLLATLVRAVEARPENELPLLEWRDLFNEIVATGELPEEFTSEGLFNIWKWLLVRPLGQSDGGGLGLAQVEVLRVRVDQWLQLWTLSSTSKVPPLENLPTKFAQTIKASPPLSWDELGRMIITPDNAPQFWTDSALRHMVWPFVIIDWLKTAYAGENSEVLTSDQFQLAVEEVLPLLQGFGWMEDSETSIFKRLMREADLFTLSSNGNELLDVSEAVRYLTFVVSAYRAADVWLEKVEALPCAGVQADCVRAAAHDLSLGILDSMPRLKQNMAGLPLENFISYMKQDEEILFGAPKETEITVGDLLQIWDLFQYVETFIQRYDRDLSDTINLGEADTSFEVYGPTLTVLLSPVGMPEEEIEPFYTFMMKFGDTPFTMWGGSIAFNYWKWHQDQWSFEAERATLMSILNQLSKL